MRLELHPYLALTLATVLIDQLSKLYIYSNFLLGESKQVLGDFVRFTFVFNPGGAFGITFGNYWLYTIFSLIAVAIVVVYFLKSLNQSRFIRICLSLVVGGAIGNLIDRILYQKVIDFIDVNIFDIVIPPFEFLSFRFNGFELYRWYTFNIADSAITVSLIGVLIFIAFINKPDEKDISNIDSENPRHENSDT